MTTETLTEAILSDALPPFLNITAPAPDSGARRSPVYVERSRYDNDYLEGRAWLLRVCDDGDCEVEIIGPRGVFWEGFIHHTRVRRISVEEWNVTDAPSYGP